MKKISAYFIASVLMIIFSIKAEAEEVSYEDRHAVNDLISSVSYGMIIMILRCW